MGKAKRAIFEKTHLWFVPIQKNFMFDVPTDYGYQLGYTFTLKNNQQNPINAVAKITFFSVIVLFASSSPRVVK